MVFKSVFGFVVAAIATWNALMVSPDPTAVRPTTAVCVFATIVVGEATSDVRAVDETIAFTGSKGIRVPSPMDQLMVDAGDLPVEPGEEVVILGRQGDEEVGAAEWAALLGTIPYEIVCGIGPRVPRRYLGRRA